MTTNEPPIPATEIGLECCMCGDYGFSHDLFHCKICQFRSQHRYCSDLYPKAESYRICNWCLINRKDESKDQKLQICSNLSSSNKPKTGLDDYTSAKKSGNGDRHGCLKNQIGNLGLQVKQNRPIKKQRSLEGPPPPPPPPPQASAAHPPRKKIVESENLRRSRSEEISNRSGLKRQVIFRNKVRRYKLLDEVGKLKKLFS